jgi:hypothetical protein
MTLNRKHGEATVGSISQNTESGVRRAFNSKARARGVPSAEVKISIRCGRHPPLRLLQGLIFEVLLEICLK